MRHATTAPRNPTTLAPLWLLVGTKKGAFFFRGNGRRQTWQADEVIFLGHEINHVVMDPRDGRTLLMAARTGHLGPTVFRSQDGGRKWKEAKRPPAFPPSGDAAAPAVDRTVWLTPGHASQPGVWYAGTTPHGLFRSEDAGVSWEPVAGFLDALRGFREQRPGFIAATPGGPITHSILIDPRDPNHMYIGLSTGGFFESADAGKSWQPLNQGVAAYFLPVKDADYGHDPHCAALHPANPDRLYQQNHCGVYRLDRPGTVWKRIGRRIPKDVGDIGFPIVLHPRDPETVWVFPMDASTVWPRTSPGGKPAAYRTRDGGRTWERQDRGLPRAHAYFTVMRQAFAADARDPVGLYFGTTSGELWASRDEGASWEALAAHLPYILSVTTAVPA